MTETPIAPARILQIHPELKESRLLTSRGYSQVLRFDDLQVIHP